MPSASEQIPFSGFSPQGLSFFRRLAENNNKGWFDAHRREFEETLLRPFTILSDQLSGFMLHLDPLLLAEPSRTLSRIHRDTRFSRDKSPYKTNLWLAFKRSTKGWQFQPCWFFEMAADWYRYGMGFYSASGTTMDAFRRELALRPARFRDVIAPFAEDGLFTVEGEQYKKPRKPDVAEDLQNWRQRKSFYVVRNCAPDELLFSLELAEKIKAGFTTLAPLYNYLWELVEPEERV